MQTHCFPRALQKFRLPDKEVRVFFSIRRAERAFIFIHGYSGDAVKTWSNFDGLLPGRSSFIGSDIYFYGYDGLKADMYASAAIFRDFLERLLSNADLITQAVPVSLFARGNATYKEVIIVAHSLGAVIARRALIDATIEGSSWPQKVSLVLYAPAHMGASVVDLAADAIIGWRFGGLVRSYLRFTSPLIDQLKPGSDVLVKLLEDTENLIESGRNKHLIARRVFVAEYEKIVVNKSFCEDPSPKGIPRATHTSVCKPRIGFLDPLHALEECV